MSPSVRAGRLAGNGSAAGECETHPRVWLLIPIETKAREYHAKLLLSCVAAEAGFGVILGHKHDLEINARFLPKGIFFLNNVAQINLPLAARCRRMGHRLVAWCEEGIAYRNRESYRHERVSRELMHQVERFFAWGDYQAEDVRRAVDPADADKVLSTGSPRLDLLRPGYREIFRDEAERIRARHGRFVLVNTNFHRFNHYLGRGSYLKEQKARGKVPDAESERFFQRWIQYLGDMYEAFLGMIRALSAALPADVRILVRPHPSEDHLAWERDLAGLPNVQVRYEGSALPWILASELLVHNGCATGIEAFVMEVPVISYRPLRSEIYDGYLANALNREADTKEELLAQVAELVRTGPRRARDPGDRPEALACFSGLEGPLASERIRDALQGLDVRPQPFGRNALHAMARRHLVRGWPPTRRLLRRVTKGQNPFAAYVRQKFPSLELPEVERDLAGLKRVSGRFPGLRVDQVGDMLFRLTSPGS